MSNAPWRSMDTAPKDGSWVLLHVPRGLDTGTVTIGSYHRAEERDQDGRFVAGQWDGWRGMDADTLPSHCEPAHWAPLPPPPGETAP